MTVPQPPTQPITDATAALRRMPTGGTACVKPADPVAQFRQDLQNQYHEQLNRDVYSPNSVVLAQAAAMVFEAHLEQHQAVVAEKDRTITQLREQLAAGTRAADTVIADMTAYRERHNPACECEVIPASIDTAEL